MLKQFHIPELMSILKERASDSFQERWKSIRENMLNIVSIGFGTELFITHDSSLLLEAYNVKKGTRSKAVFQHKASPVRFRNSVLLIDDFKQFSWNFYLLFIYGEKILELSL